MARRVETLVTLTDDLDGSKADRTITFAVDGTSYEIDLSKRNAAALEKALRPYVEAARKVKTTRGRRGARRLTTSGRRTDLSDVREWARANGHQVSDRGRLPVSIIDEYDALHLR
jgi:hypothetical protein